jgi:PAS domain-containing protein
MKSHKIDIQSIFHSVPGSDLVVVPDIPRFTIVAASDAYLKATKTKREEIIGKGMFEVFPDNPDDTTTKAVGFASASFTRVVELKREDVMGIRRHDIRVKTTDGEVFKTKFWRPVNYPIFGHDGDVAYILHHLEDITESILRQEKESEKDTTNITLRESRAAALICRRCCGL